MGISTFRRVIHGHQKVPAKSILYKYKCLKRALAATIFQMCTDQIGLNDYL
jgi:hypothetical protein